MRILLLFQYAFFFISFSFLMAIARTSKTMLNNSSKNGNPCLVLDCIRNVSNFSSLRIMFAMGLSYMAFIMLMYVPSMPIFWIVFIININGCWVLQRHLLHLLRWSYGFYLSVFNVVYHTDWFVHFEESSHTWGQPNLIMMNDLFNALLNSVC